MLFMKKILSISLVLLLALSLFAAGTKEQADSNTLVVGATPEPHAVFLELVVEDLAQQGITLKIQEFTDYVTPNEALESGELDANFFQHIPYLESFNKERGYHLVNAGGIHVEPFALYSEQYNSIEELPKGATIAIPNDPTNEGRALLLLQSAGLLTLDANVGLEATPLDIASNPKGFSFREIEAASLPRVLSDVDAAIINGNYAIPAGLIATRDGLLVEGADSPYVNVVAVKQGRENDKAIVALVDALRSEKIASYVAERYPNGEVVLVTE
ncbi:methionine ABC transporter substrate-binding protein [Sphaerochaeta halotolerans]|jgi:D-methionine transport system substrate-binding protein|nr:methionine ABC transporter substrate-binding protein [Sphaerochaeta halotolerans]